MDGRDYVAEMRNVIDQVATGEYIASVAAGEIVEKLDATNPGLLTGWLRSQAVSMVHQAIASRDRSRRTAARTHAPRSVFAGAAGEYEQGNSASLYGLLQTHYVVNNEELRKPLASMTAGDLTFVANDYRGQAKVLQLEAAFFTALARKVGTGTVGEKFTDETLRAMRDSLKS